ncbi:MAG: xylulokinase [Rhizobiales bacterium]|nr:xylulokinase [Hyphomicrobiales bacterium]
MGIVFLGLDAGTSAVKALLVAERQAVVAQASRSYPTSRPEPGWSEQDPADWVAAVEAAILAIRAERPDALAAVRAIGLSGQMHSAVLLDRDHRVLRPAMLWNDSRGREECAALAAAVPGLAAITGVQPMPGFTAAKLLWVRAHQPEIFGRIAHVLLAKDHVRLHLTGTIASDMSDAAGTQLFDQAARRWSPEMLAAVGLAAEAMPHLHEGTEVSGRLRPEVAARLGLPPGIPVAAGGGGGGPPAVYVVAADRYAPKPETMLHDFAHAVPGRWFQMAGMLNGASALSSMLATLGEADIEAILRTVEEGYRGPSRLLFLPYLTGERTPHNNPDARGVLFGLDPAATKADVVQAVLEGVGFSLRDAVACLVAADSACMAPGFIGGGARSRFWARIIADTTGLTLRRYRGGDFGPALGAARLGMIAATGAPVAEVCVPPPVEEEIVPDPARFAAYTPRYEKYRALYGALAPLF